MKPLASLLFIIAISISLPGYAQKTKTNSITILYDPSFWKNDLHLSRKQYDAIQEINSEFYISLTQSIQHSESPEQHKLILEEFIQKRSDKIWSILTSHQRYKWKKTWTEKNENLSA